ncbi:hypothetical protein [Nesterenkonia halotolerans]|uniref:Small-conductance mechanosensitive channel n=1 Tax=Nesterenkonia halotolerans TaxID=225325 RepID=A0ABR9J324_9MICC|nr:hypothetical protein [Nesterenkonia halotolerans]MBE1513405.1 small-conductance mechanosensitive channel [Nesterenkonia halotolerans]
MTDTDHPSNQRATPAAQGAELSQDTRDLVLSLLQQQQALLQELRWAYDQLERVQEVDLAQLRARVTELEEGGSSLSSALPTPLSLSTSARKKLQFSVQHPDRAVRAAGRKLRRPLGQVARKAGISR